MSDSDYSDLYESAGRQYGIDPKLLQLQGQIESSGNPDAVGPDTPYGKAQGIAQLIPATAKSLGVTDPTDPKQAIPAQAKLMAENIKRYGDVATALKAYHGGTDQSNWGPKTNAYAEKILGQYQPAQTTSVTTEPTAYDTTIPVDSNEKNLSDTASGDPFELAKASVNSSKDKSQADDPFELAKKATPVAASTSSTNTEQPQKSFFGDSAIDTAKDVLESAPTGFVNGVNNLPKLPSAMYKFASQLGTQAGNKLQGLIHPDQAYTPEEQTANIKNAGNNTVGRFLESFPTISQIPAIAMNPFMGNNLSYKDLTSEQDQNPVLTSLHQPTTGAGEATSNITAAIPGGRAFGLNPSAAMGGAAATQVANAISPDNPILQAAAAAVGGGIPSLLKSANFRAAPEQVASNVIKSNAGDVPPGGGGSGGSSLSNMNLSEIVPGSKPTLAEATQDPNLAVLERQMQMQDPATFAANEAVRENARKQYFEKAAGTPQDIEALQTQREAQSGPLYEQARTQPLDSTAITPVLSKIDDAIAEVGDGSQAGKTLQQIKEKIQGALPSTQNVANGVLDANGKPVLVPTAKNATQSPLVQIYREERDNLQKPSTADGAYAGTVKSVIQPIVSELGSAIESQSKPFAAAQQVYRDLSPQIDAAQWMQNLKLTDATGRFTLAKVNNAYENAQRLQNSPGLNSAKNLSPVQMETLKNLRDDLLRREGVARASMPRNSTTVQNTIATNALNSGLLGKANGLLGGGLPSAAGAGIGSLVGSAIGFPQVGAMAGDMIGRNISKGISGKSEAASNSLQNYLLNPENYKQYLANSLKDTFANRFKQNLLANP